MQTLPESVCFRVTRFCNARCSFCLAPPDGEHPGTDVLLDRIDWLLDKGVRVVHFCGGEPTIHPGIAALVEHVHSRGSKTRLTTNGILLPERLLRTFRRLQTDVKVSLHGDREFHNGIVGRRDAFDAAVQNLRRLVAADVRTSVQTTLIAGAESVVDWTVRFCCDQGVRRVNFLPFIPRGLGYERRAEFALTSDARKALRATIRDRRKAFAGRL
jgi:MoaA/NifB/PqqE/SkfB family radical SAM enzyme